jgi:hypothetical protein
VSRYAAFEGPGLVLSSNCYHDGALGAAGWTETDLDQGAPSGDKYLILDTNTAVVISPAMDFGPSSDETLRFRARTYNGVTNSSAVITASISVNNGLHWTVLGTRTPTTNTMTEMTAFDVSGYSGSQVKVKFEALGAELGRGVGIDDLRVEGLVAGTAPSYVTGYSNLAVGATSQTVSGLQSQTTYYYRVRAEDGIQTSVNSNTNSATTPQAKTLIRFR